MEQIPILKFGPVLLASIQTELNDNKAEQFQDSLLQRVERELIENVLIDITALEFVDSFIIRILYDTAKMARIMDSRTIIVGMRPEVTLTLLEMGFELKDIETAIDIETGLNLLGFAIYPIKSTSKNIKDEWTDDRLTGVSNGNLSN